MAATLTTFSEVQQNIQKFEDTQAAATATTQTQDTTTTTDTTSVAATTTDTQQANVDTTIQQVDDTAAANQTELDESSSNFSIGTGDDTTTTQQAQTTTQPTYNWKEEIKKIPIAELLKEAGITDFAIEINEHIAKGGKPVDYLSARAIDYNAISDESLIKDSLKKIYKDATPDQINLVYNRKYGVPEDATDEDKMFADLQLKSEANTIRQTAIAEQSKFKVPDAVIPQDEAYLQWKEAQNTQAERSQKITDFYAANQATKNLHESKRVTISLGDGVKPYNFIVDKPEAITNAFTDGGQTWQKLTSTATGEPDVPKQQLIALFSYNPQQFMQSIFNYGKSMGVRKELVEGGQNAQRQQAKVINADPNAKPIYKMGTYNQ